MADDVVARREEGGCAERENEADCTRVRRAVSLTREGEPAQHDEDRADEQRRAEWLVESDEGDRDGHERRSTDDHGST